MMSRKLKWLTHRDFESRTKFCPLNYRWTNERPEKLKHCRELVSLLKLFLLLSDMILGIDSFH